MEDLRQPYVRDNQTNLQNTCLVGLTSKKYGTIADAKGALLLLAFLVDL
jgi:hypothetical protein